MGKASSKRAVILGARDFKTARVETPEWSPCEFVYVRTLSALDRVQLQKANLSADDKAFARIAARVVCDEVGDREFGDEDVDALADKSGEVLDRIVTEYLKLSGMQKVLVEDAKKKLLEVPEWQLAFELCLAGVGGERSRHPDYLLDGLSDQQWADWIAFSQLYGTPQIRGDVHCGIIAHSGAQPHIKKKMGVKDFYPKWGRKTPKRQTVAEMKQKAETWAAQAKKAGKK